MVVVVPELPPRLTVAPALPPMATAVVLAVIAPSLVVPVAPPLAATQEPALHVAPPVQRVPQMRQLAVSFMRSTQSKPHCVSPASQPSMQAPLEQT
jgi:hypothetical protein